MMGFADLLYLLLFAGVGGLAQLLSARVFGHWLTPLSLFIGVNCASLCAYHLRLLEMKDVSLVTHLIVLTGLLAFGTGCLLGVDRRPPPAADLPARIDTRGLVGFVRVTGVLCTIGWIVAALIIVQRYGGPGMILANLWMLQNEFQMQGIGYMNMMGILVLPAYVMLRSLGRHSRLDTLLTVSALWGLLLAGIKAFVFYSALSAIVTLALVSPVRFRARHVGIFGAVLTLFFVAYNAKVDIFVAKILTPADHWFSAFRALHWPYLYFVGAWPAMQNIVDGQLVEPGVLGAQTLYAMWKILGDLLGVVPPVPFAQAFTDIGPTLFNVYSIFGILYQEWTWVGAVAICALLGFVSSRLYLRARRAGYWGHVLVYGLFSYGLFMSCFQYVYRFNEMLQLLYIYLVGFVLMRGGVLVERGRHD